MPAYGYRRIWGEIRKSGHRVNIKKVYRIYRTLDLQKPVRRLSRRVKRSEGLPNVQAEYRNHVWAMDFCHDVLTTGRRFRALVIEDEYTRKAFEPIVDVSIRSDDITRHLEVLFQIHGKPSYIRVDHGPEFRSKAFERFVRRQRVQVLRMGPGKPYENGKVESLIGRFRDEGFEDYERMTDAREGIRAWFCQYNTERPHSSLGYEVPEAVWERSCCIITKV